MMSQNLSLAPKLVYLIQKMKQDKVQAAHSALIFQRFFSLTTPLGLILKLGPHWMNGLVGEVCMLKDQIDSMTNLTEDIWKLETMTKYYLAKKYPQFKMYREV